MKDFLWSLLMTAESGSGEKFPIVLLVMLLGTAVAFLFAYCERKCDILWLWIVLNALLVSVTVVLLMMLGSGLSELLLTLLFYLLVRVAFVAAEGRDKA